MTYGFVEDNQGSSVTPWVPTKLGGCICVWTYFMTLLHSYMVQVTSMHWKTREPLWKISTPVHWVLVGFWSSKGKPTIWLKCYLLWWSFFTPIGYGINYCYSFKQKFNWRKMQLPLCLDDNLQLAISTIQILTHMREWKMLLTSLISKNFYHSNVKISKNIF